MKIYLFYLPYIDDFKETANWIYGTEETDCEDLYEINGVNYILYAFTFVKKIAKIFKAQRNDEFIMVERNVPDDSISSQKLDMELHISAITGEPFNPISDKVSDLALTNAEISISSSNYDEADRIQLDIYMNLKFGKMSLIVLKKKYIDYIKAVGIDLFINYLENTYGGKSNLEVPIVYVNEYKMLMDILGNLFKPEIRGKYESI